MPRCCASGLLKACTSAGSGSARAAPTICTSAASRAAPEGNLSAQPLAPAGSPTALEGAREIELRLGHRRLDAKPTGVELRRGAQDLRNARSIVTEHAEQRETQLGGRTRVERRERRERTAPIALCPMSVQKGL
jgi:hypothetical protein